MHLSLQATQQPRRTHRALSRTKRMEAKLETHPTPISRSYLLDADPLAAAEAHGLQGHPSGLIGVDGDPLVAVVRAAGLELLVEAAARRDLELADALVSLVEGDAEVHDVLRLVEVKGDLALFVFEVLLAAPAGAVAGVHVARQTAGAAAGVAAPVGRGAGVVGAGVLGDGGPLACIDEGCVCLGICLSGGMGASWGRGRMDAGRRRSRKERVSHLRMASPHT